MLLASASVYSIVILLSVLTGCKSIEKGVDKRSDRSVIRVETMVPYPIPSDSLFLRAFLECDSLNNVLVSGLEERKSKNISSALTLTGGVLTYSAKTERDSAFVKQTAHVEQTQSVVTIQKIKTVYKRGFFFWSGMAFWIVFIGLLAIKISGVLRKINIKY